MIFQVNMPTVLATTGKIAARLTVNVVPRPPSTSLFPAGQLLTLNDAASLAAANSGNTFWSAPLEALSAGMTIALSKTTSSGLVVSAVPPGVGISIDFS
jgi:hypothetical protein